MSLIRNLNLTASIGVIVIFPLLASCGPGFHASPAFFDPPPIAEDQPPRPGSFAASSSPNLSSIRLTWTAGTDIETPQTELQYLLCRGSSVTAVSTLSGCLSAELLLNWSKNTLEHTVNGLATGTLYFFNLLIRDASGNTVAYVPVSKTVITVDADGDGVSPPLDPDDLDPCVPNTGGDADSDGSDFCADPDDGDECNPNNDKDGDAVLCGADPNDWDVCDPNAGVDLDGDSYYSCNDPDDGDACNPDSTTDNDADSVPQCLDPNDYDCLDPNPLWTGDGDSDGAPCGTDIDDMNPLVQ